MTTELDASSILSEPRSPDRRTDASNIPLRQWPTYLNPIESSSETGDSTPISPLEGESPIQPQSLEEAMSGPRLTKAHTTGEYIQQTHQRLGSLPTRKFSFADHYGLDELRAPPILPDRERRKSLEHAWTHKPELPKLAFRDRILDDIVVGSWITFLAIWGSLARIGLSALSTYPGQPVFQLIWAQFIGCAVMGFLLQDKTLFPKDDRYVALYIGLTTGFCGSVTSFSSFIWDCFQALANLDPFYERARGKNVLALLAQIVITLCISIAALRFGAHCAQATRHLLPSVRDVTRIKRYLDTIGIIMGFTTWAAAGIMAGLIPKWRPELFTTILAPAGNFDTRRIR